VLRLLDDETRDRRIVVDRIGIRHRAHARPTARDRRRRARLNRLFILLPRLAQVRVQVYETGRDDETLRVEYFRAFGHAVTVRQQRRDAPVLDQ
jgi:hypothetical protein